MLGYDLTGPPDAPVLVLGGSLGTSSQMWRAQVAGLAEHFRVLRYDHRGHGGSPAPPGPYRVEELGADVLALLDHLEIVRCHYAGLSLGAMVGMWLAATAPTRIDRLALLCTAAYLPPAWDWHERARQVRAHGTAGIAEAVLARWFTPAYRKSAPAEVAAARADLIRTDAEGYAGCCEAIAAMDLRPLLPRIAAPTLVVAGADDPATPPSQARAIAAAVPGAQLVVLPDAAHLASVEQPAAVHRLLTTHLNPGRLHPGGSCA